jgi:hypothetical protein
MVLTVAELAPALQRHLGTAVAWRDGPAPAAPGVYVWSARGAVLYIGSAASLARRLADYDGWIAGYDPQERWEVSVIHMLKTHGADVSWIPTLDYDDALILESRLIEWHRAAVGIAPVVVGWEAKKKSRRAASQTWAQSLWNDQPASSDAAQQPSHRPDVGEVVGGELSNSSWSLNL